ncbi:TatD family hydrolase [bacterium]|nr:TatD family hydrolase [bacterium]
MSQYKIINTQSKIIDTHAHLNDPKFAEDLDKVIERANDAEIGEIIVCGYDLASSVDAVYLAERYSCIFATVGVHPHDSKSYDDETANRLMELSEHNKVLAIGEVGLDFHYDFSPRADQFRAFEAQIDLAGKLEMPIVVHSRDSNPEALQVIKSHAANIIGGVFHYFSGDVDFARHVLDLGLYIGVDGPVTYKTSEVQRQVVKYCPLDRILIETDCPYLAPIPKRGKRNEPAYARIVAEEVARLKGISIEELAEVTTQNARRLFSEKLNATFSGS